MPQTKKPLTYNYALRSFIGFLEGTEKSSNTIESYRLDMKSFSDFLRTEQKERGKLKAQPNLSSITPRDLERYSEFLSTKSYRSNTRRRKLMTLRKFLRYLQGRKKLTGDLAGSLATPHKVERIPETIETAKLLEEIKKLPASSMIQMRNRALLWTLAETGAQVSEITKVQYDDWSIENNKATVTLGVTKKKKGQRRVCPISSELFESIQDIKAALETNALGSKRKVTNWVFTGFNKFGPLTGAITSRGVELLTKQYAKLLGYKKLNPRTIRHSTVLHWYGSGEGLSEIQYRLGLKTDYAFRAFQPLLKQSGNQESQTPDSLEKLQISRHIDTP